MNRELLRRSRSAWIDQKILLEDAKDSEDKELIDKAYHDLFTAQEVLTKLFGFTDRDFERWEKYFWNDTKRWGGLIK